jgi:phosphate-selective porin OprO/OprP
MTLKQFLMNTTLGCAALLVAYPAAAQTSSISRQMQSLQDQIQQLQQQMQSLQGQVTDSQAAAQKAQQDAAQAQAQLKQAQPPAGGNAVVSMSPGNRPTICTEDGQNCISLTSRLHIDYGDYLNVHPQFSTGPHSLTSGTNIRRARIGVLGKFAGDWNYALIYDFGGSTDATPGTGIENAFITYNGFHPVAVDLGYLDVPFTLDEATSSNDIMFMERAEVQNIVTNMAANDFRSALGVRSNDDRYWAGVYLTGPQAGSLHTGSNGQQLGGTARFTYQLLQGSNYSLHAGVEGEYVFQPRANGSSATSIADTLSFSDRPELRVDPTAFLNTGAIPSKNAGAYGGELAGGWNSLFFQGEYYQIFVDQSGLSATAPTPELNFDGGYAEASWTFTGESRKYIPGTGAYSAIVPAHPLGHGGFGAFELAVRYSYMNLDSHDTPGVSPLTTGGVFGGRAYGYAVGLNWYPVTNLRFMLDYIHDDVNKIPVAAGSLGGTTSGGVHLDAVAMRAQVAF